MKNILSYFKRFFIAVNKTQLLFTTVLAALLIFFNYYFGMEKKISQSVYYYKYFAWVCIFSIAWIIPFYKKLALVPVKLLLIPPFLFALKMTLDPLIPFSSDRSWNIYWNHVFYWPFLLLVVGILLWLIGKYYGHDQRFFGSRLKGMDWKPYLIMLAMMLPLVALASTQPDFQEMYPKLRSIEGFYEGHHIALWQKLLFEISYGSDFITIEFFFRGFLVLAFAKWAGKDAILPMACFYCTIHFGKPLGECISSYFGGMLLGIVVYNTRSIYGGLMVHLGIAWLMELFGYLVN